MSSDYSLEIRLMHLEDQINRMNMVLADQSQYINKLKEELSTVKKRQKALEEGILAGMSMESSGLSDTPPDGVNR